MQIVSYLFYFNMEGNAKVPIFKSFLHIFIEKKLKVLAYIQCGPIILLSVGKYSILQNFYLIQFLNRCLA